MLNNVRPWHMSFFIHSLALAIFLLFFLLKKPLIERYEIPIEIKGPVVEQKLAKINETQKVVLKSVNTPPSQTDKAREVFGASRDSYTDNQADSQGIEAKKGNSLSKSSDNEKLLDSDPTALPVPTEEYLVSQMPTVLKEVRPQYPKLAQENKLEGSVILDILIDAQGVVRQVKVIEGPEIFRANAVSAMEQFKFSPAKVDGQNVAVRIRYTLNFQLEF